MPMWSADKQRFNKLMGTLHSLQDNETVGASLRCLSGCLLSTVQAHPGNQRLRAGEGRRKEGKKGEARGHCRGQAAVVGGKLQGPLQISKMSFPLSLDCPPTPCPIQGEPKTRRGKNKSASTDKSSLILFSLEGPNSLGQASTFGGKE